MTFATWWRSDPLPVLPALPPLSVCPSVDRTLLERLTNHSTQDIDARFQAGNRPYVAFMGNIPAAYGWVATQEGAISDLQWTFALPAGNCYLYNFRTLPEWRGRGIYPHLLQTIMRQEQSFDRFWIGYLPENNTSGRGISKAGFHVASDLVVTGQHVSGLTLFDASERALASVEVFHLPLAP